MSTSSFIQNKFTLIVAMYVAVIGFHMVIILEATMLHSSYFVIFYEIREHGETSHIKFIYTTVNSMQHTMKIQYTIYQNIGNLLA